MYMDKCEVCSGEAIDTHHIAEQHTADENGMIEHYHKNNKFNLVALCKDCHHGVHHGNLEISGYELTSSGIKLKYKYNTVAPSNHNTSLEDHVEIPIAEPVQVQALAPDSPVKTDPSIIIQSGKISRKKFNKAKIDIIQGYKDNYNSYKALINTLFTEHNIKIGQITLKKILDGVY